MNQAESALSPSDVVGDRIRELRRQRGWTAKDLAERCAKLGATDLTAPSILNIETGRRGDDGRRRRNVTVDELLALSWALSVAPVKLLFPMQQSAGEGDGISPIAITPDHTISDRAHLRRWVTGAESLSDSDFYAYVDDLEPDNELAVDEDRLTSLVKAAVHVELDQRLSDTASVARLVLDALNKGVDQGDVAKGLAEAEAMISALETSQDRNREIITNTSEK